MRQLRRIVCAALVTCAACGPKGGVDTDGGSSGSGGEGESSTGGPSSGAPTEASSTGSTEEPTTGPEEATTTGAPTTCPEVEAPLTSLWTAEFASLWNHQLEFGDALLRLADGRLAVVVTNLPDGESAAGLLLLSATGELIGPSFGVASARGWVAHGGAVDAAGQIFVLSATASDEVSTRALLTRFAADGALLGEVELEFPDQTGPLAVADVPVVAGWDAETDTQRLAKVDPETGAPLWQVQVAGPKDLRLAALAVGPEGEIYLAAESDRVAGFGPSVLRLWRFAADGTETWARAIEGEPFEEVTDLQRVGDQLVVLRGGPWPQPRVELQAFTVADGEALWQRVVAESDVPSGGPWSEGFHVEGEQLLVPITRVRAPSLGDPAEDRTLEVHTLTAQGQAKGFQTLGGPPPQDGSARTRSVRGACGELVLLSPDMVDALWLTGLGL